MNTTPEIEIDRFTLDYVTRRGSARALDSVTLRIAPGEHVAVVGESGAGKSSLVLALLGLLPGSARIVDGSVRLGEIDPVRAEPKQLMLLRGGVIGYVPQDPTVALSPVRTVGQQLAESLLIHRPEISKREAPAIIEQLLGEVGIDEPARRVLQFPHELSGGMRQRILIAIALSARPSVIVADEPTSGLDVTVQKRILDQIEVSARADGRTVIFVTHDLAVAAERADRIVVMRGGRIVEDGPSTRVMARPAELYTRELLASSPSFHLSSSRLSSGGDGSAPGGEHFGDEPLVLSGVELSKVFDARSPSGTRTEHLAVTSVSLELRRGLTTAVVGESGSGKTTVARMLAGLERPTRGEVLFHGNRIPTGRERRGKWRRRVQYVHQNPASSLDPRYTVHRLLDEPLEAAGRLGRSERRTRIEELLDSVALPQSALYRRPRELSGGQLQRVAIARALALDPEVLILDEPVSALDVTVQAKILELLGQLQRHLGIAYLLVSHDLAVVQEVAHTVLVMQAGSVVEHGAADKVLGSPEHPFTKELISAIPRVPVLDAE